METLTLEQLAPYLPYGLKVKLLREEYKGIYADYSMRTNSDYPISIEVSESVIYGAMLSEVKPILRSLSDITKEIEHNGERFVPIVELMKISYSGISTPNIINEEYKINNNEIIMAFIYNDIYFTFGYSKKWSGFEFKNMNENKILFLFNQIELFKKLHEWHFDTQNLIKRGLAISY